MFRSREKRDFAEANSLTLELEQATVGEKRDGFAENKYGAYEPIELRDREIEAYEQLSENYPRSTYYKFLLAKSYWRSAFFEQAISMYEEVARLGADYSNESVLMLACINYEQGARDKAQALLDKHNKEAVRRDGVPSRERIEDLYPEG